MKKWCNKYGKYKLILKETCATKKATQLEINQYPDSFAIPSFFYFYFHT